MVSRTDRRLFWTTRGGRSYVNFAVLEARLGSLRLIRPTLRAWNVRIATMLAGFFLPPLAGFAFLQLTNQPTAIRGLVGLGSLAVAFAAVQMSTRPFLGFLADHPVAVEESVRAEGLRKKGRGALPELQVTAWGQQAWIAVVASMKQIQNALTLAGQAVPLPEPPHS